MTAPLLTAAQVAALLGHPDARLNGVYRIVAVAQDINDGRIVTLFRAECVTV